MTELLEVGAPLAGDPWTWLALVGLGALLALDETSLGQTWLSMPVPTGLLAGLIVGRPDVGLAVGVLFQLATVGNLPVGMNFTLDPVGAVIGMTGATVLGGWAPASLLAPHAAAHWGWLLLGTCLASLAGHAALEAERGLHLRWMLVAYRTLRDGKLGRIDRLQTRCLMGTAARGALLTLLWLVLAEVAWLPAYALLPDSGRRALALVIVIVPGLAVGSLIDRYGRRGAGPVVAAWAVGGFLVTRFVLARILF